MATDTSITEWVRAFYKERYCDENGRQKDLMSPKKLAKALKKERPEDAQAIDDAVNALDAELYARRIPKKEYAALKATAAKVAADTELDGDGASSRLAKVIALVSQKHPEIHPRKVTEECETLQGSHDDLKKMAEFWSEKAKSAKPEKSEKPETPKKMDAASTQEISNGAGVKPTNWTGFLTPADVQTKESKKKPTLTASEVGSYDGPIDVSEPSPEPEKLPNGIPQTNESTEKIEEWLSEQYRAAFTTTGFIGWSKFKNLVNDIDSGFNKKKVRACVKKLREPGHKWSFTPPDVVMQLEAKGRKSKTGEGVIQLDEFQKNEASTGVPDLKGLFPGAFSQGFTLRFDSKSTLSQPTEPIGMTASKYAVAASPISDQEERPLHKKSKGIEEDSLARTAPTKKSARLLQIQQAAKTDPQQTYQNPVLTAQVTPAPSTSNRSTSNGDLLSRKMQQLQVSNSTSLDADFESDATLSEFSHMDLLLSDTTTGSEAAVSTANQLDSEIRHAPLISEGILLKARKGTVPQYGLLGTYAPDGMEESRAKIFLNTNVPFSAFICGVQGSGKSHTTACILENALIESPNIGRLENPVSAMIFSYGEFSSDGGGFSISEAAFLAASQPAFPGQCVKKITVLTSPSNKALGNLYRRLPNVTVIPFKLKSRSLDINTMLKLMAVNEAGHTPLYLATVESILREMATASEDGRFDYTVFKGKLKNCKFNPMQKNALDQRLALLESYLDSNDHSPEPTFEPGEVTIMDLSCPFTDANTACVMFKIGLQRYLQSKAYGKMIVLDEAHKYMLNVPGAKALTDYLLTIVRLQRHYGARVVISTQEPTVMSELIPLCSLKVIHRFSSPEWFAALRKHIPMSADDKEDTLLQIEQLKTGAALVYSSEAVLGKTDSGRLIKGTGRLLKVSVRKRVTSDGGQSIMSV